MSDTPTQNNNCCPKEIFYQEVRLWAIAYLRYKERPKSHKINGKFESDIRQYKAFITKLVNDHSKKVKAHLRVAFKRETIEFPGDLYVRLEIYLEHANPKRFPYFKRSAQTGADEIVADNLRTMSTQANEVINLQNESTNLRNSDSTNPGTNEDAGSEANLARNIQATGVMSSSQAIAFGMGPGPVTPPNCPPDKPDLSVSEVAYVQCAFQ
jgi:hypothetical protein